MCLYSYVQILCQCKIYLTEVCVMHEAGYVYQLEHQVPSPFGYSHLSIFIYLRSPLAKSHEFSPHEELIAT